jgi:hypothetical protein
VALYVIMFIERIFSVQYSELKSVKVKVTLYHIYDKLINSFKSYDLFFMMMVKKHQLKGI